MSLEASSRPSVAASPAGPLGRTRAIAIASLLGATLFWAGNYVVGAAVIDVLDPLSLVFLRWLIALGPLLVIAHFIERPSWRAVLATWPWLLALAIFGLLGYNLLLYFALEHTDAFDASLINAFNPALITLAAAVFLRERLTLMSTAGVLIALVGVLIVLSKGDISGLVTTGFGRGEMFMVGAIFAWTAYTIIGRLAPRVPPITSTALQAGMAVVILTPLSFGTGGPTLPPTSAAWAALLFIAIFPSVLSYLLWNRALRVLPAAGAGVFLNLITVFTAVITIIAGQPSTLAQFVGGAIVIGGVVLTNAGVFRRRKAPDRFTA